MVGIWDSYVGYYGVVIGVSDSYGDTVVQWLVYGTPMWVLWCSDWCGAPMWVTVM